MEHLTLILAATVPRMGIGRNGMLPWHLKREMQFFKNVTMGGVVIMGRRTWESIPAKFRPLQGRTNIVITSKPQVVGDDMGPNVLVAPSLQEALAKVTDKTRKVFIIGGAQLYSAALKSSLARHIVLTEVYGDYDCDTFVDFAWSAGDVSSDGQWKRATHTELVEFTGLSDVQELNQEGSVEYKFTLWNKENV